MSEREFSCCTTTATWQRQGPNRTRCYHSTENTKRRTSTRVGNFGLAILIVTVIVKLLFFPLANKSYASMAKMKAVQPEMAAIRERRLFSFVAQSGGEPVPTSPDCAPWRRQDEAAAGA